MTTVFPILHDIRIHGRRFNGFKCGMKTIKVYRTTDGKGAYGVGLKFDCSIPETIKMISETKRENSRIEIKNKVIKWTRGKLLCLPEIVFFAMKYSGLGSKRSSGTPFSVKLISNGRVCFTTSQGKKFRDFPKEFQSNKKTWKQRKK